MARAQHVTAQPGAKREIECLERHVDYIGVAPDRIARSVRRVGVKDVEPSVARDDLADQLTYLVLVANVGGPAERAAAGRGDPIGDAFRRRTVEVADRDYAAFFG